MSIRDDISGAAPQPGLHSCIAPWRWLTRWTVGSTCSAYMPSWLSGGCDVSKSRGRPWRRRCSTQLRELGLGDLSVGWRVRAMWEALHGRPIAYDAAMQAEDQIDLEAALARNVWRGAMPPDGSAARLARLTLAASSASRQVGAGRVYCGRGSFPTSRGGIAMNSELHQPLVVDRLGPCRVGVTIEADATECAALAVRMGIPAVLSLACVYSVMPGPDATFVARGHLRARVVQTCVILLDDFDADLDERFCLRFVPLGEESEEVDPRIPEDEVVYECGLIDLGEAAAEQLALALDPYPRKPGAVLSEAAQEAGPYPFDVLLWHGQALGLIRNQPL